MREINLFRTLPVCIASAIMAIWLVQTFADTHIPTFAATLISMLITAVFCIYVRLGKLSWFEKKDGKKHSFIVWLEEKIPFLRADFYRK